MTPKPQRPPIADAAPARASVAVLAVLVAWWLLRALAPLSPTMFGWGVNVHRFLPAALGAAPWALAALLLLPPVGARVAAALERALAWFGSRRGALLVALACAVLVFALADRTWLTGDFMVRQGAAETGAFAGNFTNALPGERLLDGVLAAFGSARGNAGTGADASTSTRALEALLAAALAWVSLAQARAWGLRGTAAVVAGVAIAFAGVLVTFTGLGRPAALLVVLAAVALLGATRLVASGRGGATLGLALAAGLLTHRAALALLPLALVALWRARGASWAARAWAALPPLVALALAGPTLVRTLAEYDLAAHLAAAPASAAAPAWMWWLDRANALVLLAPALPFAIALLPGARHRAFDPDTTWLAAALALPALAVVALVHPVQGVFRDLDVFAPAAMALALPSAHVLGVAVTRGRVRAWLVPALLVAMALPGVQWLAHFHDARLGVARVQAFATEPPARSDDERARLWDLLAYRAFRLRDWPTAVVATAHGWAYAPNDRAGLMWGMARTYARDYAGAESVYTVVTTRWPDEPIGWLGLAGVAMRLADSTAAREAVRHMNAYPPGSRERAIVRQTARAFPELWPPMEAKLRRETGAATGGGIDSLPR